MKKLAIGNDHVAVEMKKEIQAYLEEKGYEVINVGTDEPGRFDYPISGYKVGKMVANGEVDGGVLICGTGVGISLAANKVKGVRCALCADSMTARMTREHNDTNALALGAGVVGENLAREILFTWLDTPFSEAARHQRRIDKISAFES